MHFRGWIRDEIRARLASLPGISTPVLDSIAQAVNERDVPAVAISFRSEDIEPTRRRSDALEEATRELVLAIVIVTKTADDVDTLAHEIEGRMLPLFQNGVDHRLLRTAFQDPSRGEFDYFSAALEFQFRFTLLASDPSRISNDGG